MSKLSIFVGATLLACSSAPLSEDEALNAIDESITGGTLVTSNTAPYSSVVKTSMGCTATKIGARRFLTAAHCLAGVSVGNTVQITNALNGTFPAGSTYTLTRVNQHPSYENGNNLVVSYDIGVFDIGSDTATIPALGIDSTFFADGTTAMYVGYGCDRNDATHSGKKQRGAQTSISLATYQGNPGSTTADAQQSEYTHYVIDSGSAGVIGCPGDSGGPLLRTDASGAWVISGVNSYFYSNSADPNTPTLPYYFHPRTGNTRLWIGTPQKNVFTAGSGGIFIDKKSSKCIGVAGGSTASNTDLRQYHCDVRRQSTDNQYWSLIDRGSGFFSIKNGKSGLCIGVDGASTASGARIAQYACDGATNQSWKFVSVTTGYYSVVNKKSNLCIGVSGASTANDVGLFQFACDNSLNQSWIFSE